MLREQLNGIQHVGIPTNDIEATIEFYGKLDLRSLCKLSMRKQMRSCIPQAE